MNTLTISLKDYLTLNKPRILVLLDLAALAGAFLGIRLPFSLKQLIIMVLLLIAGSLASGGAGMINEGLEVDRDRVMKRTSKRPTVVGSVTPNVSILIGAIQSVVGVILGLLINPLTALFIALGVLIYVFLYTMYLKPRTWWNIVIGGFAGSAAAWAGFSAITGSFSVQAFLLGLLIFMWTPGHFWSLALRMREDYINANYPMLPSLTTERNSALAIAISNFLMLPLAFSLYFYTNIIYLYGCVILSMLIIYSSVKLLINPTKEEAWESFKLSSPYLALIFILIMISRLF
ncbi:protoheme IX farnesyltransferase [Sulfolobales archaeon HS-7]|nr:protoheme IX farnesyltransferase [Sulfolobales archaeon HS-7]